MAEITDVKEFGIESSLDIPADQYQAIMPSAQVFLEADPTDEITLEAGFVDGATGEDHTVRHLTGPIDEYVLDVKPSSLETRVGGRDKMAELFERRYKMAFLRTKPKTEGPKKTIVSGEEPEEDKYLVGTFRASEIAQKATEFAGLKLSWECRDYTIVEDMAVNGRPLEIIKQLVEPWSLVPMFAVDVFVQNKTVICRPRNLSRVDETWSVKNARITQLTVKKNRPTCFGKVTLYGKNVPKGLDGGGGVYQPTEKEEIRTVETKDERGTVLTRVVEKTTYRMPEKLILRYDKSTYVREGFNLVLKDRELKEKEWEAIHYNETGAQNQPRQLGESSRWFGIHAKDTDKRVQELKREVVRMGYDEDGYQAITFVRRSDLNLARGAMEEKEREVRTLRDVEYLKTEETTSLYKLGTHDDFYLQQTDTKVSAGLRPGGPRPGRTITIGGGDTGPKEPLKLEMTVSQDVWAKEVQYSNPNLTQEDLQFIMDQFVAANGKWQVELTVRFMAMPWVRKGMVLRLTDLADHLGTPIPLRPALVADMELRYDESEENPSMVSALRAFYWE